MKNRAIRITDTAVATELFADNSTLHSETPDNF